MLLLALIDFFNSFFITLYSAFSFIPGVDDGVVTELPFDIDVPLQFMSSTIHGIINIVPIFDLPFNLILIGLQVKIGLMAMRLLMNLLKLARG